MGEDEDVVNEYRVALGWALPGARSQAYEIAQAFALARQGLAAGAWGGPVGESFGRVCEEKQSAAETTADECVAALERRHHAEPVRVPATDRRARFI